MIAHPSRARGALTLGRVLLLSQLREQPGRLAVTVLSIALGVALGAAVYLVNAAALNEFGLATKRLVGDADVVIRGPRDGFAEQLYEELARDPAVRAASPVLELEVALPADRDTLKVLGLDPFVAATLQPALIGDVQRRALDLFAPDAIMLSNRAAGELNVRAAIDCVSSSGMAREICASSMSCPRGLMPRRSASWTSPPRSGCSAKSDA